MIEKNLKQRMILIGAIVIFALMLIWPPWGGFRSRLSGGLDIAGGVALIYEINDEGIDDPELAAWTHRQLTPHPVACYTKPIRLMNPAGNGRPMTYIACTSPRYPVSAGMHEKVQAMPHIRYRPIAAGHNCIISAPGLVADELLAIPR